MNARIKAAVISELTFGADKFLCTDVTCKASYLSISSSHLSKSKNSRSNLERSAGGKFIFSWGFSLELYRPY